MIIKKAMKSDIKRIAQVEMLSGYHKKRFNFIPIAESLCQEPPVKDWWHDNATLHVVLEHAQNSTSDSNHSSQTSGILTFEDKKEEIFVLTNKNMIVGYIDLKVDNKIGEINFLSIIKSEHGKGLGLKLMKFVLNHAKKRGCKKVMIKVKNDNFIAISLYNKLKFNIVGFTEKKYGRNKLKMEKKL